MAKMVLTAALVAVFAVNQAHAQEAEAPAAPFTQAPVYVGIAAAAGGVAAVIKGISLVSKNGDARYDGRNTFYTTGPSGYLWVGFGAATAVAGAALIDWSTLTESQRASRRAKMRGWSYAAIGGGALLASLGGALVLKESNNEQGSPSFGAGRAFGWSAAVLGTAAALVGIEGLTLQVLNVTSKDGEARAVMGLGYRGAF
ncbi:MAG: hypothetical protein SF187_13610 [Deltaproteobacteria bacterium]|nr:hypothetical protein [Deltaproteobacteria bacterium]